MSHQDPQLISRDELDLSQLRRHVRDAHAHQAARGVPRANRDLASWHAGQHHRFHCGHIHRGPYVLIKDRDGRKPVGVTPAPLGWFTGQEAVSREQVDAEARQRIAARPAKPSPEETTTMTGNDPLADLRADDGHVPDHRRAEAEQRAAGAGIARQAATGQPSRFDVTVTVTMTPDQRAAYAAQYRLGGDHEGQAAAARDVRDHLGEEVSAALATSYTLRRFTSYSVGEPEAQ